jgi:hypothetical protein
MLTAFTVSVTLFVAGVIIGIYVPLAMLYSVVFLRRASLELFLIWQVSWRLLVILFLFLLMMTVLGLAVHVLQIEPDDEIAIWLGFGIISGFLIGLSLFAIGFIRGRGQEMSSV